MPRSTKLWLLVTVVFIVLIGSVSGINLYSAGAIRVKSNFLGNFTPQYFT